MAKTAERAGSEKQAYHHGDLRASLMAAALALIERDGVKGFSLKDAAAVAGVSTAAPYRHFADKEALLYALKSEGFTLFNSALAEAYQRSQDPVGRLVELGVAYVVFALHHPAHFRIMFGLADGSERTPDVHPDPSQGNGGDGFLLLVKAVEALAPSAGPEAQRDLVLACWSLVHGFAMLQMEGALARTVAVGGIEGQLRRTLGVLLMSTAARSREGA
jgi:AcrR family transcriptional regulator